VPYVKKPHITVYMLQKDARENPQLVQALNNLSCVAMVHRSEDMQRLMEATAGEKEHDAVILLGVAAGQESRLRDITRMVKANPMVPIVLTTSQMSS